MWTYAVRRGLWSDANGDPVAFGYSGFGSSRNKPEDEAKPGLGPIPRGLYRIGREFDSDVHGPVCMALTPDGHDAHGRSGFLIHGDSKLHPGAASHGCIILARVERELIADSTDELLNVVD